MEASESYPSNNSDVTLKIHCDSCGAKYSIAEKLLKKKITKFRCKKCSHIIIVDRENAEAGSSSEHSKGEIISSVNEGLSQEQATIIGQSPRTQSPAENGENLYDKTNVHVSIAASNSPKSSTGWDEEKMQAHGWDDLSAQEDAWSDSINYDSNPQTSHAKESLRRQQEIDDEFDKAFEEQNHALAPKPDYSHIKPNHAEKGVVSNKNPQASQALMLLQEENTKVFNIKALEVLRQEKKASVHAQDDLEKASQQLFSGGLDKTIGNMSSGSFNEVQEWYVVVNGEQKGPFSFSELKTSIVQGKYKKEHMVWKEGMSDWKKIENVPSFSPSLQQQKIVVPPPVPVLTPPTPQNPFLGGNTQKPATASPFDPISRPSMPAHPMTSFAPATQYSRPNPIESFGSPFQEEEKKKGGAGFWLIGTLIFIVLLLLLCVSALVYFVLLPKLQEKQNNLSLYNNNPRISGPNTPIQNNVVPQNTTPNNAIQNNVVPQNTAPNNAIQNNTVPSNVAQKQVVVTKVVQNQVVPDKVETPVVKKAKNKRVRRKVRRRYIPPKKKKKKKEKALLPPPPDNTKEDNTLPPPPPPIGGGGDTPPSPPSSKKEESNPLDQILGSSPSPTKSNLPARLKQSQVITVIRNNGSQISACSKWAPDITSVKLGWRIYKTGKTGRITVSPSNNAKFSSCLQSAVSSWRFPKFSNPHMDINSVPFSF